MEWLRRLQREDGSFGELVTPDGKVEGGHDMRHCYVASAVRWMLRGDVPAGEQVEGDIDVEGLVGHLRNDQVWELLLGKGTGADESRRMMEGFPRVRPTRPMVSIFVRYEMILLIILQLVTRIVQ